MNKIAKLSILSVALLGSVTSCIEETIPTAIITADQAASSEYALEGMVGAIATTMVEVGLCFSAETHYDFAYPALMIANDALAGEFVPTTTESYALYNWFEPFGSFVYLGPLYYPSNFYWNGYYKFINSANSVIGTILEDEDYESNPTKLAYMAAAKTFRASYYLDMARLYDPFENTMNTDREDGKDFKFSISDDIKGLTVPYVSESTSESDARNSPRLHRDDLFELIFADLAEAEAIYNDEAGIGVKQPTDGVNPDLAVIKGLYARAYMWLGGFDSSYYTKAITAANEAIALSGAITTAAQWTSTTNGFNSCIDSWMWYLPQSSDSCSNLLNYVAWLSPESNWGSYACMMTPGLRSTDYNRMSSTDIRKSVVVGANVNYDLYKDATLLDEETFESYIYPYSNLKFRPAGGVTNSYISGTPTDVPLMRVDEMHFIVAEATLHTMGDAAGLALLESFMANRDSSYSTADVEDALEELIFQKRMEFWGEGIILYDLKRLEMGIHTGYTGTNVNIAYRWDFEGAAPAWSLCIPELELYQNTALVGYENPETSDVVPNWTAE